MAKKDIVVIGASAGGLEALRELVGRLPKNLPASIFVVWHTAPSVKSILPSALMRNCPIPAQFASDREAIERGKIYVAPPDHHMLLEHGYVRITKGPKENRFRPAVDPLFRSAAYVYGSRVIGIVLSGGLDDGTAGLWTIKLRGGTAIVQEPGEALVESMPLNALNSVDVDHRAPVAEIASLLIRLTGEDAPQAPELPMEEKRKTQKEIRIAEESSALEKWILSEGSTLTPFTCPECNGVLAEIREGRILRFRCHTGHAFSASSLLSSVSESIEQLLFGALRAVDEAALLLNHLGQHCEDAGETEIAAEFRKKAEDVARRGEVIRKMATENELLDKKQLQEDSAAER